MRALKRISKTLIHAPLVIAALLVFGETPKAMAAEPVVFGVAGPFTGDNAEYGTMWKRGFDIALEEINSAGGVGGRPIELVYEDTQSEPKQAAAVAQKFVRDTRILGELGDFTTTATWSASPIYQRAGLVQLAFNPSHPELTRTGDYVFSLAPDQIVQAEALANVAISNLGAKRLAILNLNTDFGKAVADNIANAAKARGIEVVAREAYLPTDKDFKTILTKVKDANPDVIALGSYYTDAALIAKQARELDIKAQLIASSSIHSPALFTLGGTAVNGLITNSLFNFATPSPLLVQFTKKYEARYKDSEPDTFATQAYDALRMFAEAANRALKKGELTRAAFRDELAATKDFPSVSQESITYNDKRKLANPQLFPIVAQDGKFIPWRK